MVYNTAVSRFSIDALFAMGPKTVINPEKENKRRITNWGVQVGKALLRASTEQILNAVENILTYDIAKKERHTKTIHALITKITD